MNDEMRTVLAQYLRNQAMTSGASDGGGGGLTMPQMPGQAGPDLPQMSLRGGANNPMLSAEQSIPMGGGDLTMRGNVGRNGPQGPVDWGAMLGYNKQF